jgi:hypothetical protein
MQAEDEQSFLTKQLQLMQQGAPTLRQDSSPMRAPPGVQKTGDRRSGCSPGVQGQLGSPKKVVNSFLKAVSAAAFKLWPFSCGNVHS